MFRVEMLPACEGDCLILSWGEETAPRRMLIDGGRKVTAKAVLDYAEKHQLGPDAFELFIITHIDRDHIEGAVDLLKNAEFRKLVKEVWFNGRKDLDYAPPQNEFEEFGALDGERLTKLITSNGLKWNKPFGDKPVAVIDEDNLPVVPLDGGLKLTIVSPDPTQLQALAQPWDETIEAAPAGWETMGPDEPIPVQKLAEKKFTSDSAKPNGSSIAVVAEFDERCVLLTGDAHVPRLVKSLRTFRQANPEARFAAVKAPHHGSRANTSVELVELLDCPLWLISTNGAQFKHPDQESIARMIWGNAQPTTLVFNYKTDFNRVWERGTKPEREFECRYGDGSVAVDIV